MRTTQHLVVISMKASYPEKFQIGWVYLITKYYQYSETPASLGTAFPSDHSEKREAMQKTTQRISSPPSALRNMCMSAPNQLTKH